MVNGKGFRKHTMCLVLLKTLWIMRKEKDIILSPIQLLIINVDEVRHVLVVVRGKNYKDDPKPSVHMETKPVMIGVDGGADAILNWMEAGYYN